MNGENTYIKFKEGDKGGFIKKIITMVFVVSALLPQYSFAEVNVNIGINVPLPAFVFSAPPAVVFIPGTYVYAVPDVDIDIVFYQGYWYLSTSYNGPWKHIDQKTVPIVLFKLPPDYRHILSGHQRIPYGQLEKSWENWEKEKYWDKQESIQDKSKQYKEEKKVDKQKGKGIKGKGKDKD